jgi:hypothetical protein
MEGRGVDAHVQDVRKRHRAVEALRGVSLAFEAGRPSTDWNPIDTDDRQPGRG